jgi:GNAT superfamily N-acetyltransferase
MLNTPNHSDPRPEGLDPDFIAERVEATWFFDWLQGAPDPARSVLATSATRLSGGGIATSMVNDPVAYWSKVLGFERPVTRATIQEIIGFYRANGTPTATIQIAPDLLPRDWPTICDEFGLTEGSTWIKLSGSTDIPFAPAADLRVAPVDAADLNEWAETVFRGFGMPIEHLPSLAAESARRGAVQPFGVWDGTRLIAGASLAVVDGVGTLLGAATLEGHRGRGAQTALIAIRAEYARRSGVTRLVAETGRPGTVGANPSLNNLVAAGLVPAYERVNWEWTAARRTRRP